MNRNRLFRRFCFCVLTVATIFSAANLYSRTLVADSFFQSERAEEFFQTNSQKKKKEKNKERTKEKMVQAKSVALQPGIWGANGIGLTVEETGGKIEYDCADGEIEQKIRLDKCGSFVAAGVHIPLHGGPLRLDSPPERQPVRYEGKISGNRMTLKVVRIETNETIGEYVLERDKFPRIHRCL